MTPDQTTDEKRAEEKRLDRESMRYLTALDNGDFDTLDEIYRAAESDQALSDMLQELNAEVVKEQDGEKVYRGFRFEGSVCVLVNATALSPVPSQQIRNHSPDGFEWGYSGSGPAQLALAILLDVTGDCGAAEANYQEFKRQFVAGWNRNTWQVSESQVREWLNLSQTREG